MTTLEYLKNRCDIQSLEQEAILQVMVEDAMYAIKDYCHRKVFPEELEYLVKELVYAKFQEENDGNIASIQRGDTNISYKNTITSETFTEKQKQILNGYRRLRIG